MKSLVLSIMIILLASSYLYADEKSDAKNRGNATGKALSDTYSSQSIIKTKLYNPLVGDGVKMNTLKESWTCPSSKSVFETQAACTATCSQSCVIYSFDAKLQCTSSTEAVTVQPYTFSAGGEVSLKITYDTDLDGTTDTSFTTSNISGFCTNGYVSCTPGIFQNCKYYEFGIKHKCYEGTEYNTYRECNAACSGVCKPSDNKTLAFQRSVTEMRHAGGCFCSNASCGSSFNGVFNNALSYFGGALTGHMMSELGLALTNTDVDVSTLSVKYYAASAASCTDLSDDTVDELKSFYQTGNIDYDNELTEQMADSDSMYNTMTAQTNKTASVKQCAITNTPSVTAATPDQTFLIPVGQIGDDYWSGSCNIFSVEQEITINDVNNVSEFILSQVEFDDWIKVSVNNQVVYVGPYGGDRLEIISGKVRYTAADYSKCELGKHWSQHPNVNVRNLLVNGVNKVRIDVVVAGEGEGYAYFQGIEAGSDSISVIRDNNCSVYANDSTCRLQNETVNDTYETVTNYTPTNIIPQSICRDVTGSNGRYVICDHGDRLEIVSSVKYVPTMTSGTQMVSNNTPYSLSAKNDGLEWFSIKRTYVCQDGTSYDFSGAKAQADTVGGTLDKDSGDFSYISEDGISSGNVKLDFDSYETCSYICTVQTGNQDTTIFPDQETRADTSAVVQEQRPCGTDYSTGTRTCPYDSTSETLLSGCACTNSFNEVIGLFSSITDAVKDMICSSTNQQ